MAELALHRPNVTRLLHDMFAYGTAWRAEQGILFYTAAISKKRNVTAEEKWRVEHSYQIRYEGLQAIRDYIEQERPRALPLALHEPARER